MAFRPGDFSLELSVPEISRTASEEEEEEEEGLAFRCLFQHKRSEWPAEFRRCSLTSPQHP